MAQAVGGLVGVHRHVQHIRRVHVPKIARRAVEFSSDDEGKVESEITGSSDTTRQRVDSTYG